MAVSSAFTLGLLLAAFPQNSCSASPEDYRYAIARRGCTQEDAPALEIYLTRKRFEGQGEPAQSYLRIEVAWTDWTRIADSSFDLIPLSRHGVNPKQHVVRGELKIAGEKASSWLSGRLVLKNVDQGRQVEGSYDLLTPDRNPLRGTFRANWIERGAGCG